MSLRTIKGKSIVLLAVLIVGFVVLGYQVTKSNNDGKMAAIRLTLIGDVNTNLNGTMMELRGYQLLFNLNVCKAMKIITASQLTV